MKTNINKKKIISLLALSLFTVTGTYNAVVINSQSDITGYDVRFVKRLDEVYGVVKPGRLAASIPTWQKIDKDSIVKTAPKTIQKQESRIEPSVAPETTETASEATASAAIQDDLNLSLVEVVNPKKWQQPLNASQFGGSLTANNGTLESLDVSLPNGEGVSVSFSEMTGNVFQYDLGGEIYSGMMYQVDQTSYRIVLTGGPLDGTALRFTGEPSLEQAEQTEQQYLAETNNTNGVEAGNFAQDPNQNPEYQAQLAAEQAYLQDQISTEQAMQQGQAFNFEGQEQPATVQQ